MLKKENKTKINKLDRFFNKAILNKNWSKFLQKGIQDIVKKDYIPLTDTSFYNNIDKELNIYLFLTEEEKIYFLSKEKNIFLNNFFAKLQELSESISNLDSYDAQSSIFLKENFSFTSIGIKTIYLITKDIIEVSYKNKIILEPLFLNYNFLRYQASINEKIDSIILKAEDLNNKKKKELISLKQYTSFDFLVFKEKTQINSVIEEKKEHFITKNKFKL